MNRACCEITGFSELLQRFERNISILGRSKRTFENYSRHVAALALHFGALPTDLHPEQVKDYLFELQQRSNSPSQSYFKHTVYGLRFLLKSENLPYDYLHLPSIPKEKKLPVILSREEIWRMLQHADLLKHRLLIGLIYGCGLRCMEVRNIELKHLDFDRKLLHIVQSKGKKDRYVPLPESILLELRAYYIQYKPKVYLFEHNANDPISTRTIQAVFKNAMNKAQINKKVGIHGLRHSYATHLLEQGTDMSFIQKLLGHNHVKTTEVYAKVTNTFLSKVVSPLDTLYLPHSKKR